MKTIQQIKSSIYSLLEELEEHESMEHRMLLSDLATTCLQRWKQIQDAANECDGDDPEEQVNGHSFIACVRCENTGDTELHDYKFNTLKEAKDWCIENEPSGSYRNFVRMDIYEIGIDGDPVQWHYKTPNYNRWYSQW